LDKDAFNISSKCLEPGMVAVLGVPWDERSSFMRGSAQAPARIREVLHAGSTNLCAENGIDLANEPRFIDLGDLDLKTGIAIRPHISNSVAALVSRGVRVLCLGGDHAITYPIVAGLSREVPDLSILHLDAHPDLYDEFEGDRYSHACPFARIMEDGLAKRLVQIGIRGMNPHQREQAGRFHVEVIEMRDWQPGLELAFDSPLYLSLDMDVLDPAFAPGVSHHEPGGLSTRDVIQLVHRLEAQIVGADIVEVNPQRDPLGITAMAAAKLLKEIAGSMLETS
jgi:agmatinase